MPPDPKAEIRSATHADLKAWGKTARAAASGAICEQLDREIHPGATVLAFWPLPSSEPDIRPALHAAIASGADLFLPRTAGTTLHVHRVEHLDGLEIGSFGVREPSADWPEVSPAEIDLVFVPGVAFTRSGHRLGRGGGHYDRLLSKLRPDARTIGVAFAKQLREILPTEPHDMFVNAVITDC